MLAQHFGDSKYEISGGRTFAQLPGQPHSDDLRNQHGDGLTEHGRLGFNAANSPAEHAQSINHGGM